MSFAQFEVDLDLDHNADKHHHHEHHHHGHAHGGAGSQDKIRVYGADWCPWTRKQKEELQGANIEFEFIDCAQEDGQELCVGITGFPTIEIKGEQTPGFKPAEHVSNLLAA